MNTGGVKFEAQTEAGGKDYTELVFRLKVGGQDIGIPVEVSGQKAGDMITRKSLVPYKNPAHFNVKNEIAHVRFKTRELDGLKVLNVEEMQSDFAIAARKGFQNNPDAKLMDFPYKNNWYELTIKRLLRYAADNNFDAVAIPKGSVAAKRYGETIGKAQEVNVTPFLDSVTNEPVFQVRYFGAGNREIKRKEFVEKEIFELEKEIGSKNFAQLKNNIDDFLTNKPDSDLKNTYYFSKFDKPIIIGSGKGKYELYDKAIPSFIKKYTKKWNAQVYDTEINTREIFVSNKTDQFETIPVTIIKLTDDMKQSVQQDGQALFSIFGIGAGAKIASDSMQNNIISEQTN